MNQQHLFPFQNLDAYRVAREIARRVHESKIRDRELRDQATRAAKSCFLCLCEGLPNEGAAMRQNTSSKLATHWPKPSARWISPPSSASRAKKTPTPSKSSAPGSVKCSPLSYAEGRSGHRGHAPRWPLPRLANQPSQHGNDAVGERCHPCGVFRASVTEQRGDFERRRTLDAFASSDGESPPFVCPCYAPGSLCDVEAHPLRGAERLIA